MFPAEYADRIEKLPVWARHYIADLLVRIDTAEPRRRELQAKIDHLSNRNRKLCDRIKTLEHILTCAGRGGHEDAKAYVEWVMRDHDSTPDGE